MYYGMKCSNNHLRAQNNTTDLCKVVDDDKMAHAFIGVGSTSVLFALIALGAAGEFYDHTSDGFRKCLKVAVAISIETGGPCLYFGYKCKNAELRAEHKSGKCKNIHNDASAIALQAFGWIFLIPFLVAVAIVVGRIIHWYNEERRIGVNG